MFAQVSNGFNTWTDVKASDQSPKIIVELSSQVPRGRIFDRLKFTRFGVLFTRNHLNRTKEVEVVRNF